ncbi:CHC2 zinc finger domain-containing protein [Brucella abortus]|nr:CHC2 zinc finger domain-containing protein [Brucella abortus]
MRSRDRVPISTLIGTRVSFDRKKSKSAQRAISGACCPFHGEKTPSFHCEDRKGRYHCFRLRCDWRSLQVPDRP